MFSLHRSGDCHEFAADGAALMVMRRGNRIREMRARAGVSTTELGKAIGMTQSHVSRLENAKVELTAGVLYRIADALKIDARELLAGGEPTIRLAALKADLRSGVMLPQPYRLVPLPISIEVDAFLYDEESFLFAEPAFLGREDHERAWIVRYVSENEERVEACEAERGGTPAAGFTIRNKGIEPNRRWLKVGDPRITESWRIIAEFNFLQRDWPRLYR